MEHLILPEESAPRMGRWPVGIVAVLGACVLAGTLVVDVLAPVAKKRPMGRELEEYRAIQSAANVWDGTMARLVERSLGLRSRSRRWLSPFAAAVHLRLGRIDPAKGILLGNDGWMFLERRVQLDPQAAARGAQEGPELLLAVQHRLAAAGLPVCFAIVPRKATLAAQHLEPHVDPVPGFDDDVAARCIELGLNRAGLLERLREECGSTSFRWRDTHWSDDGVRAAARALATRATLRAVQEGELDIRVKRVTSDQDLPRSLGIARSHPSYALFTPTEREVVRWFEREEDPEPAVALAGTSYSRDFHLHARLALELDVSVRSFAQPAKELTEVLAEAIPQLLAIDTLELLVVEIPSFQLADLAARSGYFAEKAGLLLEALPPGDGVPDGTASNHSLPAVGSEWMEIRAQTAMETTDRGRLWLELRLTDSTPEPAHCSVESGGIVFRLRLSHERAITVPVLGDGRIRVRAAAEGSARTLTALPVRL